MNSLHYEFKEGIGRWAYLMSRQDFLFKVSRLDYNFVPKEVLKKLRFSHSYARRFINCTSKSQV
jgi:hypothetical protein